MKKTLLTILALASCAALGAQERPSDFQRLTLEELLQPFALTNNAAGMGLSQPSPGSKTQIGVFSQAGDFHRAQEGKADTGFDFSTLRYDTFHDKLFMKGSFHYTLDREKERKWSDVMDPWLSIPFIYGSAIAKDYTTHDCGLTFDLYTAPLWDAVSFGIKTDYAVADISGLRDPRPRTGYLDWQAVPSVLVTLGNSHVGLDFGYGHSKEKLSGLTTIQSYPNLYYYKMSGLDHVDGTIAAYSGFKRQFSGGRVLGDLSYAYTGGPVKLLVSGGMEYRELDAYGDKMQSPGSYDCFTYNGLADLILMPGKGLLHRFHLEGKYGDGGANELLQELTSVKDPVTGATTETWETLYEYKNRYMLKTLDAEFSYKLFGTDGYHDYRWSAGVRAGLTGFRKQYFLPASQFEASGWNGVLEGSVVLFARKGHKVDLAAEAGYYMHCDTVLDLHEDNLYTQEVLVPDSAYYSKDFVHGSASLTWQFPLNLGKAGLANGYVRVDGGLRKALPDGSLSRIALTVGLFTF
ncbi:MAG: hypothetical protein II874_00935 [Bacteroidales bacterium]|nr:hypothetical protein [Bacteroidales bacterium]